MPISSRELLGLGKSLDIPLSLARSLCWDSCWSCTWETLRDFLSEVASLGRGVGCSGGSNYRFCLGRFELVCEGFELIGGWMRFEKGMLVCIVCMLVYLR